MMEKAFGLFPNLLAAAEGGGEHHGVGWGIFFYLGVVLVAIFALMTVAVRGLEGPVFKNPLSQMAEQAYLFAENLCVSVIGHHGRKYVPFILTLWMLVFFSNVLGLVLPHTPSADWSITLALALVVIAYVQWEGIRANGFFGHLKHFAGPKLVGATILITPLIFAIEVISEIIKILSLSVRLYGNISAGHTAKNTLDQMIPSVPILGSLLFPLEFLVAIIQAFVFVLLTCVYLALVTSHGDDHGHEEGHHAHPEIHDDVVKVNL
jgi:F-type H+-transporting ATPase subunit a